MIKSILKSLCLMLIIIGVWLNNRWCVASAITLILFREELVINIIALISQKLMNVIKDVDDLWKIR